MTNYNDYRAGQYHQHQLQGGNIDGVGVKTRQAVLVGSAVLALVILGIIFLTAIGEAAEKDPTPPPAPTVAPVDESSYLAQALVQIPAEAARRFAFTNWDRIRSYHGFTGNSQETSLDDRLAYMLAVLKLSQPAAQLDRTHFNFQEQNWGWDSTDLLWEAQIEWQASTESAHLLQFRPDFDFTPLLQLLRKRGFATTDYRGVTIYAVPLTETPDWHYRSNLAHHTMAFPGGGLVVMAPTPAAVARVLYVRGSVEATLAAQPQLAPLLPELAQMMAVEMQFGAATCTVYGSAGVALSAYSLLVVGHQSGGDEQQDRLFLAYDDVVAAEADLAARRDLLQWGASNKRAAVYGDILRLEEAGADGRLQRFRVSPTEELRTARPGWPQTLLAWIQDGDAPFAGCGQVGETGTGGIR